VKINPSDIILFLIICGLLWFTNKQHDHIAYLEDTIKIQDKAISQQTFLIECQKFYINKRSPLTTPTEQNKLYFD
jgi:hypothetical protein